MSRYKRACLDGWTAVLLVTGLSLLLYLSLVIWIQFKALGSVLKKKNRRQTTFCFFKKLARILENLQIQTDVMFHQRQDVVRRYYELIASPSSQKH